MVGADELQAEGGAGGSLNATEPARGSLPQSWFTDEMVETVAKALYSAPMPVGVDQDWWDRRLPEDIELDLRDARIALQAIAPMVEKLLDEAEQKAYDDGFTDGGNVG